VSIEESSDAKGADGKASRRLNLSIEMTVAMAQAVASSKKAVGQNIQAQGRR